MKHAYQFLIKVVTLFFTLWAIPYTLRGLVSLSITQVIIITLVLSILGYYGDVLVVPKVGRFVGALLDYPFTYLVLWLGSIILGYRVTLTGLLVSSLLVATIEYILHLFIVDTRLKQD